MNGIYPSADEAYLLWCASPSGGTSLRDAFMAGFDAARQPTLFERLEPREPRVIPARRSDPSTSHTATEQIKVRAGTQRAWLLRAFDRDGFHKRDGLTDEEAMDYASIQWAGSVSEHSEYSKRCSELREAGLIEPTGETRKGASGMDRIVSRITAAGRAVVEGLNQ